MVSLTVTEKGYCQDVNGDLDKVSQCCEGFLYPFIALIMAMTLFLPLSCA